MSSTRSVTGRTAAFGEDEGTPLEVAPADPVTEAMPLDQRVVSFD